VTDKDTGSIHSVGEVSVEDRRVVSKMFGPGRFPSYSYNSYS